MHTRSVKEGESMKLLSSAASIEILFRRRFAIDDQVAKFIYRVTGIICWQFNVKDGFCFVLIFCFFPCLPQWMHLLYGGDLPTK